MVCSCLGAASLEATAPIQPGCRAARFQKQLANSSREPAKRAPHRSIGAPRRGAGGTSKHSRARHRRSQWHRNHPHARHVGLDGSRGHPADALQGDESRRARLHQSPPERSNRCGRVWSRCVHPTPSHDRPRGVADGASRSTARSNRRARYRDRQRSRCQPQPTESRTQATCLRHKPQTLRAPWR